SDAIAHARTVRESPRDRAESAACRSPTCCRPPLALGSARCRARGGAQLPPARTAPARASGPPPSGTRSCREHLARYAKVPLAGAAALRGAADKGGPWLADAPAVLERLHPRGGPQSTTKVRPAPAPVATRGRNLPALPVPLIELDPEASKPPLARR